MPGAGLHGGERVRHAALRVVVAVDADGRADRGHDRGRRLRDLVRQRGAVRVAQRHPGGARLGGGARAAQRVVAVVAPGVEEVLAVVDDRLALRRRGRRPTPRSSAGSRRGRRARPSRGAGSRSCRRACTRARRSRPAAAAPRPRRRARRAAASCRRRRSRPCGTSRPRAGSKSSSSFGFEAGKPASISGTPSSSSTCATRTFSSRGERHALPLHAVAQGAVVDGDAAHAVRAGTSTTSSHSA